MRAVYHEDYVSPLNLEIKDIPIPEPAKDEVRVKIKYSAVNDWDWSMVQGKPGLYRLFLGLFKPKNRIPGMELSGIVDAVGPDVTKFKSGDEVFGDTSEHGFGSLAEYLCISQDALIEKPSELSFEHAAAISHAAMLAWQSFIDIANIKQGQKILINGGGGGAGVFGLQLAKTFNAEVSGIDTGEKLEMMKSLGYDHVYDYKTYDFTKDSIKYDIIFDAKTSRSIFSHAKVLNDNGVYVTVGGQLRKMISMMILNSFFSNKTFKLLPLKPNKGLNEFLDMMLKHGFKIEIDGPYPLEKAPWAIQYFGDGLHSGKVLIEINK